MGCSPLLSRALKSLRGKGKKREKTHKSKKPTLAKSVSQGHQNPIYVTHPPVEISTTTTWDPPQKPLDTSAPDHPSHAFPGTPETKNVVRVRYNDKDAYDRYPAHDYFRPKDPICYRHEPGFGSYSYNNSSGRGGMQEVSSSSSSREEYLCREYEYYPTPVREGIYSLATDGNHLTNIFSDENPNACSIV